MKNGESYGDLIRRHLHPLAPLPSGIGPVLTGLRPMSAILFDVYGTLLISAAGDVGLQLQPGEQPAALADLIDRYGIDQSADELAQALRQSIEHHHAQGRRQGSDHPEVDIIRVWQDVLGWQNSASLGAFALEYELIVNPVYPMPGAEVLLASGRHHGIVMGIISNAQFYTPLVLEEVFGARLDELGFDRRLIFFSWQWEHAKPALVMFQKAAAGLSAMGIDAASSLYVGNDMRNDISTAARIGFKTALFAGDRRSLRIWGENENNTNLSPTWVITDLSQLMAATQSPKR